MPNHSRITPKSRTPRRDRAASEGASVGAHAAPAAAAQGGTGVKMSALVTSVMSLAYFVLLFSNDLKIGTISQVVAIGLCALAAAASLMIRPMKARPASAFEVAIFASCCLSFVSILLTDAPGQVIIYTCVMLVALMATVVLSRSMTLSQVLWAAGYAYLAMAVVVFVACGPQLLRALNMYSADRWMLRVRPFSLQPNLTGFMFGGGVVLLAHLAIQAQRALRWACAAGALACLLIIVAASARASILALLITATIAAGNLLPKFDRRARRAAVAAMFVAALVASANYKGILHYASVIFEFESETRGLDSGGSGRTDIWARDVAFLLETPERLVIGSGLRYSSAEIIGFPTENSYLTILIDSGIPLGAAIVAVILVALFSSRRHAFSRKHFDILNHAAFSLIVFALVQSIFNRYLVAIGNTTSLLLFFLYSRYTSRLPPPGAVRPVRPMHGQFPLNASAPNSQISMTS